MSQQLVPNGIYMEWKTKQLSAVLAGDIAAATISATAISPILTAIDRKVIAVVENTTSHDRPLLSTLKAHVLNSFRRPRSLFATKPFFYIWTLYAATYTTANTVESVSTSLAIGADKVIISSITFIATCLVNVPLGVWKDVRFVQIYGNPTRPNKIVNVAKSKGPSALPKSPASVPSARFPRTVAATFLFRDAITIFGSVNLPPMLTSAIPETTFSNSAIKMAAMQIFTPVLSQVVATPIHLLGLDLYTNSQSTNVERISRMKRSILPTTAMRCSRIIPAFGVGLVMNTGLRDYFHEKGALAHFT